MGIFSSHCVECFSEINWFCDLKDMICWRCHTINKAEDIQRTWYHHNLMYSRIMEHWYKLTLSEVRELYKEDRIAQEILKNIYWHSDAKILEKRGNHGP